MLLGIMSTISLENSQNSRYAVKLMMLNLGTIAPNMQYGLSVMNPMIDVIKDMYNETYYERYEEPMSKATWQALESLTMSIILGGAFFGAVLFRVLLKLASRKHSMLIIHSINIIGCVIAAIGGGFSRDWEVLIVGRFITGLALGLGINMLPLFNGETSAMDRVEFFQGLIGVGLAIGNFLGVFCGWGYILGRDKTWMIAVALPIIPSFVYLCLASWLVETPYYSLLHDTREETFKLLKKLRTGSEECIKKELHQLIGPIQLQGKTNGETNKDDTVENTALNEKEEDNNKVNNVDAEENSLIIGKNKEAKMVGFKDTFCIKQYRRQFIAVCVLYMAIMFSGLMDTLLYSTTIFLNAGIAPSMTSTATVCVFFLQVLATIPGSFILNKFGSWLLCVLGLSIITFSHVLLTISLATTDSVPQMAYMSIFAMILYFIGFSGGFNIGVFALITEITTERTRPVCVSVGGSLLWFTGWLTGFIASYLKTWMGAYSPLVWMTLSGLIVLYMVFCIPNTKSKSQDDVQAYFRK